MKKRSLFKRLLSGFVATAMALSICFSDKVFEDLFASAAEGNPTVTVKFVDDGAEKTYENTTQAAFFVVGALVNKGGSVELTGDDVVAWGAVKIDPTKNASSTVTFGTYGPNASLFYKVGAKNAEGTSREGTDYWTGNFNPADYDFVTRVYRVYARDTNGNPTGVENPIDPRNIVFPGRYTVWNQTKVYESYDFVDDYIPASTKEGNATTVTFTKHNVEYYLNVNFAKPTTIADDEYLYALIEVSHQSSPTTPTYALVRVTANNSNEENIVVQDKNTKLWNNNDQYHGNEPGTKVRLFASKRERNLGNVLAGEDVSELKSGDFAKAQKVEIGTQTNDGGKSTTKYYEHINFLKADQSDNYTYKDVLGSAVNFGIVADKFHQKDHSQTNLAVNYFHHGTGSAMEPNLSDPSAGEIYIGKFANLSTPSDLTDNGTEKFAVGASHPQTGPNSGLIVHTPDLNRIECHDSKFVTLTDKESDNKTPLTADYIKNNVVDPMIQQMQAMSNRLASKEANVTPVIADSKITVDTMDYPADATIYVDGDALAKDGVFDPGNNFFQFNKKDGQTIVINFKNTEEVNINKFDLDIELEEDSPIRNLESVKSKLNGSILSTDADSDGEYRSDKNKILDQCIMRKIVWNLNSAKKVSTNATAGIFLNPNADSETYYKSGTSTGWMITAGYFENTKGEWHFPFGEIGPYEKPKTTPVVISKKAVTGDSEIPGATLQIVDKVTGKNIGDTIWKYLIEEANEDVEALTTKVGELEDVRYGMRWTSGETAKTITLRDGSYVLKETGTTFKSGGKEYKVVTSSFDFEITNGKITKVSKDVSEDNGTIKYTDTNNTITIRDAQAGGPVTHPVHVSKTEITGQKAVAGATITVYTDTPNAADRVKVDDYETRAVDDSRGTFMLEAGKYVLVEKATVDGGAPSLNGKTYKVITTEFKFEVKEDGTVECTGAKASVDNFTKDEKANGGLVLTKLADNNEPYFIMCDAANTTNVTIDKSAVTGEHTIKNARLWLTDSTGSAVPGADITTVGDAEKDKFTVALEDGEYTIHEEAAKDKSGKPLDITDENGDKYNIIPSEVKFTVVNGTVTSTDAKASKNDLGENGGVFVEGTTLHVCDAVKPKTAVTISKTDVTGNEELKGATLTLFHANADGTKGAQVVDANNPWTSDGRAKWTVQLQEGKYILEESGTKVTDKNNWEYDVLNSAVAFTIGEDGKIAITSNNSKTDFDRDNSSETGFAVAKNTADREATLTICDAAKKTPVKFNKKDITGQEELAGATLTVYKYDATKEGGIGEKVDEAVSSKDAGSVFELELENGKYVLKESGDSVVDAAGNKYDIIETTLTFEVNNGTVTATGAKTAYDDKATTGYFYQNGTTIEICDAKKVVVPDKLKVKVDKTAVTGEAVIENAHLKIVDSNNVVKGELTTTKTDKSFEVELEDGTYTLTEEAVEGQDIVDAQGNKYKVIPSSVTFTIENGQIKSTTDTVASKDKVDQNKGGVVYSGTTFTVCDAQYSKVYIHLSKKDITGANEVKGAVITLYNAKSDGTKGDKVHISGVDNPWTSNGSTLSFQLEKGDYILEESGDEVVSNNIKYKVLSSSVNFSVDENGKVTVTSNNTKPDFVNDSTLADGYAVLKQDEGALEADLTICDAIKPKTSVKISKTDVTGNEELKDATLTLFYAKADGTKGDKVVDANNPWTSDGSAKWTAQLQEGKYILEESGDKVTDKNNWEYDILNSAVAFTIDKDGKITITSNNSKTDFDKDNSSETGFAVAENTADREATLTICDAAKKTPVKFNKKDITGQEELAGATLTVYKYDATKKGGIGKKVDGAVSSKDTGSVFELALANGIYVLEETGTTVVDKDGNEYDVIKTTLVFEVNNGVVTTGDDAKSDYDSNATTGYFYQNGTTIEICDAKKVVVPDKLTVKVDKKAITGDAVIENAHLKIVDSNNIVVKEVVTSKTKTGLEAELEDGTYTLTETAAEGNEIVDAQGNKYEIIPSSVTFTIENGQITSTTNTVASKDKVDQNKGGVVYSGTTFTVCDAKKVTPTPTTTTVKFNKKDITGKEELDGATLTVYKYDESKTDKIGEKVDEAVSSKDAGSVFELQLPDGKYVLQETGTTVTDNAGNEYDVIKSTLTFEVNNGTVTAADAKTAYDTTATEGYFYKNETTIEICDAKKSTPTPITTTVKFNKKDITGQEELAGATLTVYKYDESKTDKIGEKVDEAVSSKDAGSVFELQLPDGKYVLQETGTTVTDNAGNEYDVIKSTLTFEVNNGTVTANDAKTAYDGTAAEGYFYKNGTTIEICDAKKSTPTPTPTTTTVKFNKKDITGQEELAGATLTVYKYDESKTDKIGEKVDEAVSSKDAGSVFELQLPDGKYVLQETGTTVTDNAGNEYDVIKSTLTFEVNNGTVTANDAKTAYDGTAAEGYFYKNETTIEICDAKKATPTPTPTKTKVVLDKKTISGDEELAGAILTITKKGESKSQSWTSQIGKTWTVELEEGTYVLTESGDSVVDKDGNKYDVITSELEFTVNSDGTVTATGAKTTYDDKATTGYFYQNGTTIEICDAKKATSDDDSSKPSDDSSKPSGGDNDGDNDSSKGNKPSGGDNDGDNDSNKGKKPSGGDNDGDNDSNKGKKPSGGDEDGDNTPNTGFAGSTFAAAALLAAVSVLAVMKKKDE